MIFIEDGLHCDIFALVLIIQRIFVESCELANISQALFFSSIVDVVMGPLSFMSRDFRVRFHICF